MITHKYITKIIAVLMALAVCFCFGARAFSDQISSVLGDGSVSMEYESKLFSTDNIISINIIMDEDDWNEMLENATEEKYYQCNVEVNGTTFYQVGIRPKGNTSLTSIANDPTTNRYSFKLEFDYYVDGQTCFGLDKLVLNNNYADATNMKEALVYDMFKYIGADASLYNYAKISVNDDYWGVYLALEAVEDSFMLRNYGVSDGNLYKPEGSNMGGGNDFGGSDNMKADNVDFSNMTPPSNTNDQQNDTESSTEQSENNSPDNFDNGGGFDFSDNNGFSMSEGGADLNYSDDDLDSYSTIWDGEVTSTNKADHKRVVKALKNISEGNDLEKYMDVDNLLRYMAVHVFSVNEDSLSGTMAHNYYLYEYDGMLNIIPWDYNLAFGGMGNGSDATSMVNEGIDNSFSSTDFFDTLMDNETYHSQYYSYMSQLVSEYVNGGGLDAFYERVRSQIDELVESDPNAFYTYDEYNTAAETLYQVVKLRAQSIEGQLDGTIPSTSDEQNNSDSLIDASSIDLSIMGSMNSGDMGNGGFENKSMSTANSDDKSENSNSTENSESSDSVDGNTDSPPNMPNNSNNGGPPSDFDPSKSSGNMPNGSDASQAEENSQSSESSENSESSESSQNSESSDALQSESSENENTDESSDSKYESFSPPSMDNFDGGGSGDSSSSKSGSMQNLILYGVSLIVIIVAMGFAVLYRRKPRRK
jgi:spore coat protein CotH